MTDTLPSHASGSRAPAYLDPTFEDRIREAFHAGDVETLTNLTEPLLRARKSDSGWKSGWVALLAGVRGAFEEILEVNLSDAEPDLCLPLNTDGDPRGWLALINTQHVEDLSNSKFKGLDTLVELLQTSVYERLAAIGRRFAAPDNLRTPEVDELGRFLELLFITLRTTYDESFVLEGSGRGLVSLFAAEQQQYEASSLTESTFDSVYDGPANYLPQPAPLQAGHESGDGSAAMSFTDVIPTRPQIGPGPVVRVQAVQPGHESEYGSALMSLTSVIPSSETIQVNRTLEQFHSDSGSLTAPSISEDSMSYPILTSQREPSVVVPAQPAAPREFQSLSYADPMEFAAALETQPVPQPAHIPPLGGNPMPVRPPASAPQPSSVDAVAQPPARAAPIQERARTHAQAAEKPVARTGIDIKPASRSPSPAPIRSGSPGARRVQPATRSGHGAYWPLGHGVRTSTPIIRKASDRSSRGSVGESASDFILWDEPNDVIARLAALEAELRGEREKRLTENGRLQMVEALLANEKEERGRERKASEAWLAHEKEERVRERKVIEEERVRERKVFENLLVNDKAELETQRKAFENLLVNEKEERQKDKDQLHEIIKQLIAKK